MGAAETPMPRPLDGGQVAQAIVEYIGNRQGGSTMRGPSGRQYPFNGTSSGRRQYVLEQDLDHFRRFPDLRVLEEGRIDPEAEERARRDNALADQMRAEAEQRHSRLVAEIAQVVKQHTTTGPRRSRRKSGGRPAGRGLGAKLDCWMTCGQLDEQLGSAKAAYDRIHTFLTKTMPAREVPTRARLANMRSDAKIKRQEAGGQCLWHCHPEPVPRELTAAPHSD